MRKIVKVWLQMLIFVNLFIFLLVLYFSSLGQSKFHIDEYSFLRKSYLFDLFLKKEFQDPRWLGDNFNQPRLGPYIYGLSLHAKGIKNIEAFQNKIGFNQVKAANQFWWEKFFWKELIDFPQELEPTVELVIYGRKVAAIFGFSCLVLLLIWSLIEKNIRFGFWAIVLLGINRLMFYYSRLAMTDAFQLFFFFLNLILLTLYLKSYFGKNKKIFLALSLAIGIVAAAATGVKVIGVLILLYVLAVNIFLLTLNIQRKHFKTKTLVFSFFIIFFLFYFLFLSFNPQIYSQPIKGFWQMFASRWQSSLDYREAGIEPVTNRFEALSFILEKIFFPGNKMGNFGWLTFIPLDLIVFSLGLGLLLKKIKEQIKFEKLAQLEFILLTWWLSCFFSLLFYLKNDWPRFYLPLVAATTFIQAYFFSCLTHQSLIILKQRRKVFKMISRSVKKLTFLT